MDKKFLLGAVAALILTGGYYASAASSPLKYTDYGYTPVTVSTTTYAPGTPAQYEYPNSPYQIGGKLGPKAGQTWQQKFDAGTVADKTTANRTSTSTSTSNHSAQTAMSSKTPAPQRTTVQVAEANTSTVSPTGTATTTTANPAAGSIAAVPTTLAQWSQLPAIPSGWHWESLPVAGLPITTVWMPVPDYWVAGGTQTGSYGGWEWSQNINGDNYSYGINVYDQHVSLTNLMKGWGTYAANYSPVSSVGGQARMATAITYRSIGNQDNQQILIDNGAYTIVLSVTFPQAQSSLVPLMMSDIRFSFYNHS